MSDFPPPPPPPGSSVPPPPADPPRDLPPPLLQPPNAPPPPLDPPHRAPGTPPPPVIWDAAPPRVSWLRRKTLHAAHWVWLLALVAVAAGAVAVVVSRNDDSAAVSPATETEATEGPSESTVPPPTDSVAPASSEPLATTEATDEPPTVPATTVAASVEVPGSPAGVTGDHTNPVPVGAVADIGSGWRLQILNVNPDAAAAVAAENGFNEPPPEGSTLTLVTVALGYFGRDDPKSAFDTTISAVGAGNVELTGQCGVVPQELDSFGEIFAGGVVVGNVCFVTTPQDTAVLQLYASGDFFGGDQVFLDASSAPADVVQMATLSGPQPGATSTAARLAPTPVGTPAGLGAGWQLTISGPATDITDQVLAENQFNSPPPDGFRYIGVTVTYAYSGDGAGSAFAVTTKAVGDSNLSLGTDCGVTPGEIDLTADIFAGGSVSGIVCFVAPAATPTFIVYATADFAGANAMFATA